MINLTGFCFQLLITGKLSGSSLRNVWPASGLRRRRNPGTYNDSLLDRLVNFAQELEIALRSDWKIFSQHPRSASERMFVRLKFDCKTL